MAIERWGFAANTQPAAGAIDKALAQTSASVDPAKVEAFLKANGLDMTADQFFTKYGVAPEGGWSDANTASPMRLFSMPEELANDRYALRKWMGSETTKELTPEEAGAQQSEGGYVKDENGNFIGADGQVIQRIQRTDPQVDASKLPDFSLYGSGSPEDIQRGFNILQHLAPRNIGEFGGLSKDVQKAILQNPKEAILRMQQLANPANGDWLSVGAEGGFSDLGAYQTDGKNLTADMSKYMQVHDGDSWSGPLGLVATALQFTPLAPIGFGLNAALAARAGNPIGMVTNGLGMGGVNLAGSIGNAVGATGKAANAIGSGVMGAANAAISGKDPLKAGLSSAAASTIGSAVGDMTDSKIAGTVASKVAGGLINSALPTATNTNTSTADTSGGTRVTTPQFAAFRPTKIEKWGYA